VVSQVLQAGAQAALWQPSFGSLIFGMQIFGMWKHFFGAGAHTGAQGTDCSQATTGAAQGAGAHAFLCQHAEALPATKKDAISPARANKDDRRMGVLSPQDGDSGNSGQNGCSDGL